MRNTTKVVVTKAVTKAVSPYLVKQVPPYLVEQVLGEVRIATTRMLTARLVRSRLASQKGIRVNIGCGTNPTPKWINLDLISHPDVYVWDCRSGLPFADGSVTAIYSEHFFEHLDLHSEAFPFFRECLRCLQPGGVLRIVVPDAGAYLRAYSGPWEQLADMRPLHRTPEGWRDWSDQIYQTKIQLINFVFRQGFEHKYAYDDETLVLVMREAGFADAVVQQFGVSIDPNMAPDSNVHRTESLYVEGVKA